ncbi:MAG TPA: helix-turn-helix transcriptional regulator [Candidatus Saccharimonadales bacterium]|nr:helix-turn-helix transcriptional regulator [Candidatus Saccharimonadales bacterium]
MIYNRLAVLRTERGISRQELAQQLGVNYQTIGFIERGDYSPSLELVFKIANYFKVDITAIFSDNPFPSLFNKQEK